MSQTYLIMIAINEQISYQLAAALVSFSLSTPVSHGTKGRLQPPVANPAYILLRSPLMIESFHDRRRGDTIRTFLSAARQPVLEPEVVASVLRILILEDYPPLRRVLAVLLQQAGYRVALARTTGEALRMLGQHAYDLLVMDMDVSNADFRGVMQEVQAASSRLPVVALLSPQSHWARNVTALGVQIVLYKPIRRQALLKGIETGLNLSRMRGPAEDRCQD
jgi:CheY-like chemotaxis protein